MRAACFDYMVHMCSNGTADKHYKLKQAFASVLNVLGSAMQIQVATADKDGHLYYLTDLANFDAKYDGATVQLLNCDGHFNLAWF